MADASDSKSDVPSHAPTGCPGTSSDSAGKSSACAGCPSQARCASGEARKPDPALEVVAAKLKGVKNIVLVLSGKGGVGKSTVAAQLAFALAEKDLQVGLLDVDICGPSVPRMMGLVGHEVHQSAAGWSPVYVDDNLGVMSIGFMLPDSDAAVIWRGPRKNALIKQFLTDVDWGMLDYLIIDTPPGTSDEHISIVNYLRDSNVAGAILVTTPQEVAMMDVRKEISFVKKVKVPVLGVVENMSGFVCSCGKETAIFPSAAGGPAAMAERAGIPYLGKLPLDPKMLEACEAGSSYLSTFPDAPGVPGFRGVVDGLLSAVRAAATDDSEGGGAGAASAAE
eukprot:PLAT6593.1.p1 GENE.PLAT6593.1~~PLAT6593.1.p1  ORF type:complete len:351 (+),score=99.54 PLAT6593.1:43-1053(+)